MSCPGQLKICFNPEGNEYAKTSTKSASCSPFHSYITGKVHITSALSHFELASQEIENLHLPFYHFKAFQLLEYQWSALLDGLAVASDKGSVSFSRAWDVPTMDLGFQWIQEEYKKDQWFLFQALLDKTSDE